ncbi:MAG: outer membrane beta-barrel protein [Bacteroidia bacterium]|nr:outer membrane beta-barrel protein [Bacteroidia bacterium]
MYFKQLILIFIITLGINLTAWAQVDSLQADTADFLEDDSKMVKPELEGKFKLGIKMGAQTCTLLGSEMNNAKLTFGLLGGGYARFNLSKRLKNWSIQTESQISFRGSNFSYTDSSYSALRLLYIDVPVIIFKAIDSKKVHRIGMGVQFSYLLNSAMYLGKIIYPTATNPKLLRFDFSGIVAYQYHLPFFALQLAGKYGITNINIGSTWPDSAKPLNSNGNIRNFTVELSLIF